MCFKFRGENKIQKQKCSPTIKIPRVSKRENVNEWGRLLRPVELSGVCPDPISSSLIHFTSYRISANYNRAISSISTQKLFEWHPCLGFSHFWVRVRKQYDFRARNSSDVKKSLKDLQQTLCHLRMYSINTLFTYSTCKRPANHRCLI